MEICVRFRPSGLSVRVPRGTTLLEAARRARLPVASACGDVGLCGRCGMRILSGAGSLVAEDDDEARVKRANRVDPSERLACRIVPTDDVEVTTQYW